MCKEPLELETRAEIKRFVIFLSTWIFLSFGNVGSTLVKKNFEL